MADIFAVGIVGAGTMGGGLAEVAARAGHDVVLCSRSRANAQAAVATLSAGLERHVDGAVQDMRGRPGGDQIGHQDGIVEAIQRQVGAGREHSDDAAQDRAHERA